MPGTPQNHGLRADSYFQKHCTVNKQKAHQANQEHTKPTNQDQGIT